MDFAKVNELSKKYEPRMTRFLRDMIAIPSESCQEEGVIKRIKKEMEDVGFDRVEIDKMGNVCLLYTSSESAPSGRSAATGARGESQGKRL